MKKLLFLFFFNFILFSVLSQDYNYGLLVIFDGQGPAPQGRATYEAYYTTVEIRDSQGSVVRSMQILNSSTYKELILMNDMYGSINFSSIDALQSPGCSASDSFSITPSFYTTYNSSYVFEGCDQGVIILPIFINNSSQESTICLNDSKTLYNGYHWQYSILENPDRNEPNDWNDLANTDEQTSISVSISDLIGANNPRFVNFRAGFRGITNPDGSTSGSGWTNIVQYTIIPEAPPLYDEDPNTPENEGGVVFSPPLCSYDRGSLTFNFTEDIPNGYEIQVELYRKSTNGQYGIIDGYTIYSLTPTPQNNPIFYQTSWDNIEEIDRSGDYKVNYKLTDISGSGNSDSCQSVDFEFHVDFPTPVVFNEIQPQDITHINCYGGTGSVKLTASGGTGSYQYRYNTGGAWTGWINFDANPTHTANTTIVEELSIPNTLLQLDYHFQVRDSNECEARDNGNIITRAVTLTQPPQFSPTITGNDFKCSDSNTTTIHISCSGGTLPYQYKKDNGAWQNFPNGATETDITISDSGTYQISVKDANDCGEVSQAVTISRPPEIALTNLQLIPPSCYDASDGKIQGKITGGTLNNSEHYTIQCANNQNVSFDNYITINNDGSFVIDQLPNGTYSIQVIDSNTCTQIFNNLVLDEPQAGFTVEKIQDVSCNGGHDGQIKITATGSPGNYDYTYDGGVNWNHFTNSINNFIQSSISEIIDNLPANPDYTIMVRKVVDSQNSLYCTAYEMVNGQFTQHLVAHIAITQPDNPISFSNVQLFNPSINGGNDGKIIIDVSGGTQDMNSPYYQEVYLIKTSDNTHIMSDNNVLINNGTVTYTFSGLSDGDYLLYVKDINDCEQITNTASPYTLQEPAPLNINSFALTQVISCTGGQGVISLSFSGGTAPYILEWQKQNVSNGTWTTESTQTVNQTQNLLTVTHQVTAGIYRVIIKDHNASNTVPYSTVISDVLTVTEPLPVIFNVLDEHNFSCHNGNDGYAIISATGGNGQYQYSTDGGNNWTVFSNNPINPNPADIITEQVSLTAGNYTIQVSDLNDCAGTVEIPGNENISITEPDAINFTLISSQNPSASQATDGEIVVNITGGTTDTLVYPNAYKEVVLHKQNSATTFSPTSTDFTTPPVYQFTFSNLPGGSYYLHAKDVNDCEAYSNNTDNINGYIDLIEPTQLEVTISLEQEIDCYGNNTGTLKANASGGIQLGPNDNNGLLYYYNWQTLDASNNWVNFNNNTNIIADQLGAGLYRVSVTDANGISASSNPFELINPDELIIALSSTSISCDPGGDGTATVSVNGGTPPYNILWSTGATTTDITNLIAGTYTVTVTDAHSCSASGEITLQQPGGMQVNIVQQNNPTCYGYNDGSIEIAVTGGQPPYTYVWAANTSHNSPIFENLTAGTYDLTIIDSNNCNAMMSILLENPDPIVLDLGPDETLCLGQSLYFDISISDPGATYEWQSDNGFTGNTPQVTLTEAGTYTATITTILGCTTSDTIIITTSNEEIDADFLVTSQAFANEDIILVNTSSPLSSQVEWVIPQGVQIVSQNNETITLHFDNSGLYEITLISHQGDCIAIETKTILVNEARELPIIDPNNDNFIQEFNVFPNPSNGTFTVDVTLAQSADISLRLFSLTAAAPLDDRINLGQSQYSLNYQLNVPVGTYFLLLETNGKREIRKVIIQ